jgi:hypothetical protein
MCDGLVLVDCPGIVFPRLNVSPAMQVRELHSMRHFGTVGALRMSVQHTVPTTLLKGLQSEVQWLGSGRPLLHHGGC